MQSTNYQMRVREALNNKYDGKYGLDGEYNGRGWSFIVYYDGAEPSQAIQDEVTALVNSVAPGSNCYMLPYTE